MASTTSHETPKMIRRLNATLPPKLAMFVGEMTGEEGLYETPSELIRDLIRRYMETMQTTEHHEINTLLRQSIVENTYTPLDIKQEANSIRNALSDT